MSEVGQENASRHMDGACVLMEVEACREVCEGEVAKKWRGSAYCGRATRELRCCEGAGGGARIWPG